MAGKEPVRVGPTDLPQPGATENQTTPVSQRGAGKTDMDTGPSIDPKTLAYKPARYELPKGLIRQDR